jgi:hypothetical protein
MPLYAHQIEPAPELRVFAGQLQALGFGPPAVRGHPITNLLGGPGDVAVPKQRYEVVGQRAVDGVLEIQDPGISAGTHHEVPRVIVAVHEHARLRERGLREQIHHLRELCRLVGVECQAQVAREQPVREEAHLEPQQLSAVRRKLLGVARAAHLNLDECVDRIAVKRIGTPALLKRPQIGK